MNYPKIIFKNDYQSLDDVCLLFQEISDEFDVRISVSYILFEEGGYGCLLYKKIENEVVKKLVNNGISKRTDITLMITVKEDDDRLNSKNIKEFKELIEHCLIRSNVFKLSYYQSIGRECENGIACYISSDKSSIDKSVINEL